MVKHRIRETCKERLTPGMGKKASKKSFNRLSPHLRGEIRGLHRAGYTNRAIATMVVKSDGKRPSKDAELGHMPIPQKG